MSKPPRLIIISNRLPITIVNKEGSLLVQPGSGGLVTALAPVLRDRGGMWIGWTGTADVPEADIQRLMHEQKSSVGFSLVPVLLSKEEVGQYYHGFSNEILWPLFHDLQSQCHFVPSYWQAYQQVNHKFAEATAKHSTPEDIIWVHDYHLILMGQELRKLGIQSKISFFLHIPFPPLDIFLKLPWRFQILRALLDFDFVGFQTARDLRNFIQCVRTLLKDVFITTVNGFHQCKVGQREMRVGPFPISIDYKEFASMASNKEVSDGAWHIHEKLPNRQLIFSVDRLDYTKGIPYRLEAIRTLLTQHPELHTKVTFFQVVVPSRIEVPKYQALKTEIDELVGTINSQFTQAGWVPIHYMFRSLTKVELLSFYRTAEIALITPLKDGMNLVAKEYVASNIEENGVLILSEFAGAASQLHGEAILVNPYDVEGVANAIHKAVAMPQEERKSRMKKMRRNIKRYDIFWWVRSFLRAAASKEIVDFPLVLEYTPTDQPTTTERKAATAAENGLNENSHIALR